MLRGSIALAVVALLAVGGYWLYASPLLSVEEVSVRARHVVDRFLEAYHQPGSG